jgi:SAM-dependent methyltransferase
VRAIVGLVTGAGGWEQWEWDPSLFAGAARYYEQGRLPYAPGLADALARELGLDGHGQLLDVGCGPGTVARRLAPLFDAVTGLDPDPEMLAEAARLSAAEGIAHTTWVQERAEALPAALGLFRVITFGASFHWMDRPRVARTVRTMLVPGGPAGGATGGPAGGAVVQVDAPGNRADALLSEAPRGGLRYPLAPNSAIEELRRRYLGPDQRAGQSIRNTSPSGEDDVFQAAGFKPAWTVVVPDGREIVRSTDEIVAERLSLSGSAPHLFGDRAGQFERDLRALLADASPPGRFSVRLPDNILRIWQPA